MLANSELNHEYTNLSLNIKKYRKKLNISQEKLAEKSDISISYIKQIESNKNYTNISLTVLLKLSKALDTSLENLFKNNLK